MQTGLRRFPLEGVNNARDLGGYPADGGVTGYGKVIRMDDPAKLSPRDIEYLCGLGLKASVDLRSEDEIAALPSKLCGLSWVEYHGIPLFNVGDGAWDALRDAETLGDFYVGMAERARPWIKSVLETVALAEGAVSVNCTAGKDRTGVICAMLLGLCGVKNEDIIADYCVSSVYLHWEVAQGRGGRFINSNASNMKQLLAHLEKEYGGIGAYLQSARLDSLYAEKIKDRLVTKF